MMKPKKGVVTFGAGVAGGIAGGAIGSLPPAGAALGAAIGSSAGWHAGYGAADYVIGKANSLASTVVAKIDDKAGGFFSSARHTINVKTNGYAKKIWNSASSYVGDEIRANIAGASAIVGGAGLGLAGALPPVGSVLGGFAGGAMASDAATYAMGGDGPSGTKQLLTNPVAFSYGVAKGMTVDNVQAMAYDAGLTTSVPEGRIVETAQNQKPSATEGAAAKPSIPPAEPPKVDAPVIVVNASVAQATAPTPMAATPTAASRRNGAAFMALRAKAQIASLKEETAQAVAANIPAKQAATEPDPAKTSPMMPGQPPAAVTSALPANASNTDQRQQPLQPQRHATLLPKNKIPIMIA